MRLRASVLFGVWVAATWTSGCEGAVVGSECRDPFVRCGHYCVDPSTDGLNCGTCGNQCALGCQAGVCIRLDAGPPDGGHDAGHDAGRDAGPDAFVVPDVGTDAFVPDAWNDANVDGGGPRCGLGELLCGGACVDADDPSHCGDCATVCTGGQVCSLGACASDCGTLSSCGTVCVDETRDPRHCGDCTTDCGTGTCVAGACQSATQGHVVVIGHDYEMRDIAMSTILANAVLLAPGAHVAILGYEGDATAAAISGTNAALAEAVLGRTYDLTPATSADSVPAMLRDADSLLVYAQSNATDETLRSLGYDWQDALGEFLDRGGVVVVLETPSLVNQGTYQILQQAGLFNAASISEIVFPSLVAVAGHAGDPVLAGVTFPYSGARHTVWFSTLDPSPLVTTTTSSGSVVFHRVMTH